MSYQYKHAVLGGTFDHLHAGHKHILDAAFAAAEQVTIGITSDEFVQKKTLSHLIEPYSIRKKSVQAYMHARARANRVSFEKLDDMYGSSTGRDDINAIIVTDDSRGNAIKINDKRKEHGLPPLNLVIVPFLKGADNQVISSTRIRQGYIDRAGIGYMDQFTQSPQNLLPKNMRKQLRIPLGTIIQGDMQSPANTAKEAIHELGNIRPTMVIAIGDIVAQTMQQSGYNLHVIVLDYRTRREDIPATDMPQQFDAINPPGTICQDAVRTLGQAIQKAQHNTSPHTIAIQGEEDLLALPAILLAPLGSVILYGQFDRGIVIVHVTEKIKEHVRALVKQFE